MLKKVKILNVTELENPKFVKTQLVEAQREGEKESFYWEMIKSHDSVHVVVFNLTTQEFLLVKQARIPVLVNDPQTTFITEACAGLVDKDVPLDQIVKEEIEEEIGYKAHLENIKFYKTVKSSVGTQGVNAHLFYAEVTEDQKVSDGGGLPEEDIEVLRISIDDMGEFMLDAVTDSVTLLLVNLYYIGILGKY